MKVFENREFHSSDFADFDSAAVYQDIEFRNCYFQGSTISVTNDPRLRSTVRGVQLINCSQRGCDLNDPILEDVLVDDLDMKGQCLRTHGAVFRHVVLKGRIDRLLINNDVLPSGFESVDQKQQQILKFRESNQEFYRRVDWALDISKGEFREIDIRGVPAHLVRLELETQAIIKRNRVLQSPWRDLSFRSKMIPFMLDLMLRWESADMILIAPKLHPEFRNRLKDIALLREAGIAEPE